MATSTQRLFMAVLAGMAVWALAATPAEAQQRPLNQGFNAGGFGMAAVPPWMNTFNAFSGLGNLGPAAASGLPFPGASLTSVNSPLGFSSLYNNNLSNPFATTTPGYYTPYYSSFYFGDFSPGNTLQGAAAAISAEGQLNIQNMQARLVQQQVEQQRVQTRRAQFDQYLYERSLTPSVDDIREQMQRLEIRRAMRNPPLTDVLSGSSLDAIYRDLLTKQALWGRGPLLTVDENVLKHINLTSRSGGNVGLLKKVRDDDPLGWPASLKTPLYAKKVEGINSRLKSAVRDAMAKNTVDPGTITNLREDVQGLQASLASNIDQMTPSESVAARRFISQLDDAVTALQQPDISDHLNGKVALRGKTVTEVLQYMSQKGLSFGPATNGDEAAYMAMLNALTGYNAALGGSQP